jgi:arylsulfatase A-like enzyme
MPNVILVVLDTARADGFEPYGAPAGTTPAVSQLTSRGVAVDKAIAPCNWTMPSHVSMLTGLLPRAAGLAKPPEGMQANCRIVLESLRERLLPEVLRRRGYWTAGASANLWVSNHVGFDTGFDEFHDLVGKRVARMHDDRLRSRFRWYVQAVLARIDDLKQAAVVVASMAYHLAMRDELLPRKPAPTAAGQ